MSANVKPAIFASYEASTRGTIKPQIFASFKAPAKATVTPLLFATVIITAPPPIEFEVTPAAIGVSKINAPKVSAKPSTGVSISRTPQTDLEDLRLIVTFYRPPSPIFISKYKPQTAISFYHVDKKYYFPIWPQEDLLFFPPELFKFAWGSVKKFSWDTQKMVAGSGRIRTATRQKFPYITIETKLAHITDEGVAVLFDFIRKVEGSRNVFLWHDEDANAEENKILPRDLFGFYRLPICPFFKSEHVEHIYHVEIISLTLGGVELPPSRYLVHNGAVRILDERGIEIRTVLPEVKASFKYYWRVHFVDDGQGIERIFYNFNRSQTLKMEVVR